MCGVAAATCSCGTRFPNPGPAGGLPADDAVVSAFEPYSREDIHLNCQAAALEPEMAIGRY